ncbi:MAG: hypothetical protein IKJ43_03065 [Bacilli bacterium]|nr:hypothetical protein [Bacilli bacterium]
MNNIKDQESVITFFIKYSKAVKIVFIIFAVISFLGGIIGTEDTDGMSLIAGIIAAIILIGSGILLEKNFKWKAYMLQNTYQINIKTK